MAQRRQRGLPERREEAAPGPDAAHRPHHSHDSSTGEPHSPRPGHVHAHAHAHAHAHRQHDLSPASAGIVDPVPDDPRPGRPAGRRWGLWGWLLSWLGPTCTLPWRRAAAKRLAVQWKFMGSFGICCLASGAVGLLVLSKQEQFDIMHNSHSSHSDKPSWFADRKIPSVLASYARTHGHITQNMGSTSSKFIVHEIPGNSTTAIDTLLGLTSSFLLAIVTDRALMVEWTNGWESDPHLASSSFNGTTAQRNEPVQLHDLFAEPGFAWGWADFRTRYTQRFGPPSPYQWDPLERMETLTCSDLKDHLHDHKFVKVTTSKFFLPVLLVNPLYTESLETSLGLTTAFADLVNFLLRPSDAVVQNIERFRARYMDGNAVVGMQMSVMPGRGDWAGNGVMPDAQQDLFFSRASDLVNSNAVGGGSSSSGGGTGTSMLSGGSSGGSGGVVFLMVTDNQPQLQSKFREFDAAENVISAGLVAILGASGVDRVLLQAEVQEMWLLGLCDVILTTPGSHMGILGASRTNHAPQVVVTETTVRQSKVSYPCLAEFGTIQQTSCFEPSMLLKVPPDSAVPCG